MAVAALVWTLAAPVYTQVAAPPQPARLDVDAAQLMRDVEVLAADEMEGRLAGTVSGARARAYILERFKKLGVPPLGDSHEHPFTFQTRGSTDARTGTTLLGSISRTTRPGR